MIRCTIFICVQKLANSQLNLPHGTKQTKQDLNEETKNKKPRCSEQTVRNKVYGVSPGARRFVKEVGLEPGVKERGSYGWRDW